MQCQRRSDLDIPELPFPTRGTTAQSNPEPKTTRSTTAAASTPKAITITYAPFTATAGVSGQTATTAPDASPTPHTKSNSQTVKSNELTIEYKSKDGVTEVADMEMSVDSNEEQLNVNYIVAASAAGAVVLIGALATVLGVLASKGFFTPKGFTPVETSV